MPWKEKFCDWRGRYFLGVKMPGFLPVVVSAVVLLVVALMASMLPGAWDACVNVMKALRSHWSFFYLR